METNIIGFITLIVFMVLGFGLTTLFRKWLDIPTLIAVAIGTAINANLYTSISNPIYVGQFVFSMEIVLNALFMYTVIIRILDYGYKESRNMTYTTIVAIIISAVIELVASLAYRGFSIDTIKVFSYYLFSCIGTILGVWVMIWITIRCREKNLSPYLIIPFALIAASIIHSLFYYGGIALVAWDRLFSIYKPLGAIMGKAVCIGVALLCYFINQKYWIPNNLLAKREEIETREDEKE